MSPVTQLVLLPGLILWAFHMGNFSLVDQHEIQETKPKWWNLTCIVLDSRSFVDLATSLIKLIRIPLKTKINMLFWPLCCENEGVLTKTFRLGYSGCSVHMGKFSSQLLRFRHKNRDLVFCWVFLFVTRENGEVRSRKPSQLCWPGSYNYEEALKIACYSKGLHLLGPL